MWLPVGVLLGASGFLGDGLWYSAEWLFEFLQVEEVACFLIKPERISALEPESLPFLDTG